MSPAAPVSCMAVPYWLSGAASAPMLSGRRPAGHGSRTVAPRPFICGMTALIPYSGTIAPKPAVPAAGISVPSRRYAPTPTNAAAVAATTEAIAREALGLIKVTYEVLPHVIDVEDAMKPDAPVLHKDMFTGGVEPLRESGYLLFELFDFAAYLLDAG